MSTLDEKGRCCGRKPIVYKRPPVHLFCDRCCRAFHPISKQQVSNWAYREDVPGVFTDMRASQRR